MFCFAEVNKKIPERDFFWYTKGNSITLVLAVGTREVATQALLLVLIRPHMKYYFMAFVAMLLLGTLAYQFFSVQIDGPHRGLTAGIPVGPTIIPDGGTFRRSVAVTIELGAGATEIRYTKNGEAPSCDSGIVYDEPFIITHTTSIRAIDCGMGGQSMEVQADFVIKTSNKGGGPASNPTDVPYGPTCEIDPLVCPPEAPTDAIIRTVPDQPAYANVIAHGISPFFRDLAFGSVGADVAILQEVLIDQDRGEYAAKLRSIGSTGYFGHATLRAVRELQQSFGIAPATGYFGQMTRGEINARMGWLPSAHH